MAADASRRGQRLAPATRRAQLLDVAVRVVAGRDPTSVTYEEVAEAAGVSRGLVYNYFPDRSALFEEIALVHARRLQAEVHDALGRVPGRVGALAEAMRVHLRFAQRDLDAYASATGGASPAMPNPAEAALVAGVAESLGGGREAEMAAAGVVHAVRAMTLTWASAADEIDFERADELITAFIAGALNHLAPLGVKIHPTWRVPRVSILA